MNSWKHRIALSAIAMAVTTPAWTACPPYAPNSQVPPYIDVVGTLQGVPDPLGLYTVVVHNFTNGPCVNVPVTLDFSQCNDTRLALNQASGATVDPSHNSITVSTDANGIARFTVVGGGTLGSASGSQCVRVCAAGVYLGLATAVLFDPDGAAGGEGATILDYTVVLSDFYNAQLGQPPYPGRADLNHSGTMSGGDLALYISKVLTPAIQGLGSPQGSNGAGYCSGPFTPFCPAGPSPPESCY